MNLTRKEYKQARRMLRENGDYARRWMNERTRAVFAALASAAPDLLEARTELGDLFPAHLIPQVIKNEIRACRELRTCKPKLAA